MGCIRCVAARQQKEQRVRELREKMRLGPVNYNAYNKFLTARGDAKKPAPKPTTKVAQKAPQKPAPKPKPEGNKKGKKGGKNANKK